MSGSTYRPLGLAPLSVLGEAPHRIVEAAASAGFDFVGLRVLPVTRTEPFVPLAAGSAESRRTRAALADTGLEVKDVECLVLDGSIGREHWLPALEAAAAVGARTFTVTASDSDGQHILAALAEFTADALDHGLTPTFEPMAYRTVSTLARAAELAREVGCLVLPDALHWHRRGGTIADVAAVADLTVAIQLCDATAVEPADLAGYVHESRAHRLLPGDGDADLTGFLQGAPAGVPVSIEVPHPMSKVMGLTDFARALRAAGHSALAAAGFAGTLPLAAMR